ncbi:MAG: hypothetical protein IRZ21_11510, partial [Thermoleophilaceae bacterium]|nr:hypothetical protein [Thermoleophilaceae bacterium]
EVPHAEELTLDTLSARIARLEVQLEALEDALYREAVRQNGRISAISSEAARARGAVNGPVRFDERTR